MLYLGDTYTKKLLVVNLKFICKWPSCILSGNHTCPGKEEIQEKPYKAN